MTEIKVIKSSHFNIIRSEMTKKGLLIGGRLIAGDSEYSSFDAALEKATEMFVAEGAPKLVRYFVIGGYNRDYIKYADYYMGFVELGWEKGKKQIEGDVCVHAFPGKFDFVINKDGYPIDFFNQSDNRMPFVHPTMSK